MKRRKGGEKKRKAPRGPARHKMVERADKEKKNYFIGG
jgi:hypothetical protein